MMFSKKNLKLNKKEKRCIVIFINKCYTVCKELIEGIQRKTTVKVLQKPSLTHTKYFYK